MCPYDGSDERTVADACRDWELYLLLDGRQDHLVRCVGWRFEHLVIPMLGRWRLADVDGFLLAGFARLLRGYEREEEARFTLSHLAWCLRSEGANQERVEVALGLRVREVNDERADVDEDVAG